MEGKLRNIKKRLESIIKEIDVALEGKPQQRKTSPHYEPENVEAKLARVLLDRIRQRKIDFKLPNMQQWSHDMHKMVYIDKRRPGEIAHVIEWTQGDLFWQNNILSVNKLRKHYDRLVLKMRKEKPVRRYL